MDTKAVLVIEDEQNIAGVVRIALEREGFQITTLRTGEEGLAELGRRPFATGSGFATRHMVISLVLLVAYCVHGSTRIARRLRAVERGVREVRPERAAD